MSAKSRKKNLQGLPPDPSKATVFLRQFQDTAQRFVCQQKKRVATQLSIWREVINRDRATTRFSKNIPNFKNNVKGGL
jgi:hypothetical protein